RRLYFAPESAVTGVRAVDVLNDNDRRLSSGVDVAVIIVAQCARVGGAHRCRRLGADPRRARESDHRLQTGKSAQRGTRRVTATATRRSTTSSALQIVGVSNAESAASM